MQTRPHPSPATPDPPPAATPEPPPRSPEPPPIDGIPGDLADRILEPLDEEQRQAVTHEEGPLLVVAGAGTGKTTVIARRIAYLIAKRLAHPSEILALTFTERAAAEMEARVDLLTPYGYTEMWISTFHAFGDRIVRDHALEIGLPDDLQVLSEAERVVFFRERLFRLPLRKLMPLANPTRHIKALLSAISSAKDEGILPDVYLEHARELGVAASAPGKEDETREAAALQLEVAHVYRAYQEELLRAGRMDFGDQILLPLRILKERPHVAERLSKRFRFILVDEFQDTNVAQFELLKLLAGERRNLTVVGDDDQSIYKFRGAAVGNILGFSQLFPERALVLLKQNHRSGQQILDAAYRLIQYNNPERLEITEGIDKRLRATTTTPGKVEFRHFDTLRAEADHVAGRIAELVRDDGWRYRDVAILVRSNHDASSFLQSLLAAGIPHEFSGHQSLYRREETRLALAFLRSITRRDDSLSLYALAASGAYEMPADDLVRLSDTARAGQRPLRWALEQAVAGETSGTEPLTETGLDTARRLAGDLRRYTELARQKPTGELLYQFLTESGYLTGLLAAGTLEAEDRVRNLTRLFELIQRFGAASMTDRAHAFVEHHELLFEAGDDPRAVEPDPDTDAVRVLTVHRAKGLEYPCVFVVNLVIQKFPTSRRRAPIELPAGLYREPLGSGDHHLAEERRLFYVAMTRARELLALSSAADHGGQAVRKVSPFVIEALDLPPDSVRVVSRTAREELERFGRVERAPARAGVTRQDVARPTADSRTAAGASEVIRLSATRIEDFEGCPLRFRYAHVLRMPAPRHHAASYGAAVHDAIAAYLTSRIAGAPLGIDAVLEVLRIHWRSEGFLSREHEERRFAGATRVLARFVAEEAGSPVLPASVEKDFAFTTRRVRVEGRYDRIDLDPEAGATIIDYKTAAVQDEREATRRARRSLQLKVYSLAYRETTGAAPRRVELRFVETGLTGQSTVTDDDLETARTAIERTAEAVREGRYEARPSVIECGHCAYLAVCPEAVR